MGGSLLTKALFIANIRAHSWKKYTEQVLLLQAHPYPQKVDTARSTIQRSECKNLTWWRTLTNGLREEAADAALDTDNEEGCSVCQTGHFKRGVP